VARSGDRKARKPVWHAPLEKTTQYKSVVLSLVGWLSLHSACRHPQGRFSMSTMANVILLYIYGPKHSSLILFANESRHFTARIATFDFNADRLIVVALNLLVRFAFLSQGKRLLQTPFLVDMVPILINTIILAKLVSGNATETGSTNLPAKPNSLFTMSLISATFLFSVT